MSRITLRVGLSRSSHLTISSLGAPLSYHLNSPLFSSSVGERKIMNHFVVQSPSPTLQECLKPLFVGRALRRLD